MNALDDIRIRTGSEVTDSEAAAVIEWCRDWVRDCEVSIYDPVTDEYEDAADLIGIPALLRSCDKQIVGGLHFVLDDVRRLARQD